MSKHEIGCEVIRDLLPLCADGLASPQSRALADEHLETCEACAKALAQLRSEAAHPPLPSAKALALVKRKINRKRLRTGLVSVAAACAILVLGFALLSIPFAMRYDPKNFADIELEVTEDIMALHIFGDPGWRFHSFAREYHNDFITEDGEEIYVQYVTWTQTGRQFLYGFFSKHTTGDDRWIISSKPLHGKESDRPPATRVYYYPHADINKLWEADMGSSGWSQRAGVLERSHLIWEWDTAVYGEPVDMRPQR